MNFLTESGNKLTWFASSLPVEEVGATVTVTGTVKKHDVFRGDKVTLITRCKLVGV